jgi:hypothetical protein
MAAENDLIPLSKRPILRQPLGFSIDQPAKSISTYEASISAPSQSSVFLPGQEPKLKKLKAKKRSCVKRPRRPEAYAGQTSRFRLQGFEPVPDGDSSTHQGSGSYASMYRGVAPTTERRPDPPTIVATASLQGRPSSSTQFTKDIGSTPLGGPYYRHNYESQHKHALSLSPSQRQSAQSESQKKWGPIARYQGYPPAASTSSKGTDNEAEGLELKFLWLCFLHLSHSRPVTKVTHRHCPHPGYS